MSAVTSTGHVLEDEQVSPSLSQIVSVVAGLALLTTGFIFFPDIHARSQAKGMAISVSLAVLAALLLAIARNLGS